MKEPTYQQALSKAWQMAWHHKTLWGLGLLAAIVGQFGLGNFFGRLWLLYQQGEVSYFASSLTNNYVLTVPGGFNWINILGLIWLFGFALLLLIAIIFISVTSQGALVFYAASWFKNKRFKSITKAWHKAVDHFWQLLAVNILYKLIFCALVLTSASVVKTWDMVTSTWAQLGLGFVLGILLFLYLVFSIVYIYIISYIVVDNKKAKQAAQMAWDLLSRHFLVSIEVGLLMMFLNLILVIVVVSSLLLAFIPSVVIWIVAGVLGMTKLALFGFTVGFFIWFIMVLLIAAVYNTFNTSVWVYLFQKMHKQGIASRIVHHVGSIFKK
jgi:hypothetical protein